MSNRGVTDNFDGTPENTSRASLQRASLRVFFGWKGLVPVGLAPEAYDVSSRATCEAIQHQKNHHSYDYRVQNDSMGFTEGMAVPEEDNYDLEAVGTITEELAHTPQQSAIDGAKATTPGSRGGYLLLGCIVLVSVTWVAIPLLTCPRTATSLHHNFTSQNTTSSPPLPSRNEGNLTMTIADSLVSSENKNQRGAFSMFSLSLDHVFLEKVNRTDQIFTFFDMDSTVVLSDGVTAPLVEKLISPLWSGHKLDILNYYTIEGLGLELESIHDGMVVESLAGYPLTIHLDPFRVNNVSVSNTERNKRFKNGIEHVLLGYFQPLAPWMGKSMLDILTETNDRYNGTLSIFLALVNAFPIVKKQLQLQEANTDATTLFAPTNDGLATLIPDLSFELNPAIQQLVLNHVVPGNFAKSCWWTIPTGEIVNTAELKLTSQSGHVLELEISDAVIINGYVRVLQTDIFAEQGVIHIIDKPFVQR